MQPVSCSYAWQRYPVGTAAIAFILIEKR